LNHESKRQSFGAGIAVLTASAVIVKLIGVCYKIPLVRLLGVQGMGYFNAAYDVYALLCMISTTGLPVAVSVLMNKYKGQHKRIFLLSLCLFLIIGMLGCGLTLIFADNIAEFIGAPQAAPGLRFIAPAVMFICITGAFRGYYQGKHNMTPTAVSQIIEAGGKLVFGMLFAYIAIRQGNDTSVTSAFAILGLTVGTLLSAVYLTLNKRHDSAEVQNSKSDNKRILSELISIAFPATLGAVLSGMSRMVDLTFIMRRLQDAGMTEQQAVSMYGCYSSMVLPLFSAIPALFASVAMPLVPHLAHAIAQKDRIAQSNILDATFRMTAAISVPSALGMGMLSDQIMTLLFHRSDDVIIATPLLIISCIAIPASCLITCTGAILQAYGHAWIPMISTATGCMIKGIILYSLAGNPSVGIIAAPISTLCCCILIAFINMFCIGFIAPAHRFAHPWAYSVVGAAIAVGASSLVKRALLSHCNDHITVTVSIAVAVVLYTLFAYKIRLIRIEDFRPIKEKEEHNGYPTNDQRSAQERNVRL